MSRHEHALHDLVHLPGSDTDNEDCAAADEFHVDGERLEDDESLKMHILGVQSVFSRWVAQ